MALVIGNDEYEHLPDLANPGNDARAIEVLLADLGFETELSLDRSARRLKRDIDNFAEDAEGADVVLLYYAGHGIEAGGENWLVPVDADLAAPANAGQSMVALSSIVYKLQKSASVVIVLLDACRDNPFPAGMELSTDGITEPVVMSVSGLGETRGVRMLANNDARVDNLGTVIGFSAAPGQAALDGHGGNSPYAHAILKHMTTLAGEEFGTVMRMVAEEVFLDTSGRQRPWINENLRRLLFFGEPVAIAATEEAAIASERRKLLLTISTMDERKRQAMENIASTDGVPLDAVFAMLKALGADAPNDPAELEQVMRRQSERVKEILAERDALEIADPDIQRLSDLADKAIDEGAIRTAIDLIQQAKARMLELDRTLDQTEANLRTRRLDAAALFARSADTYILDFEYEHAANDYALAFEQVARWDDHLAWQYRYDGLTSLTRHGDNRGDNVALAKAIEIGAQTIALALATKKPENVASTHIAIGDALHLLGRRETSTKRLSEAYKAYSSALDVLPRTRRGNSWIRAQTGLGQVLNSIGKREGDKSKLMAAVDAYMAALGELSREDDPDEWAHLKNDLGNVLVAIGEDENHSVNLERAVKEYREALSETLRDRHPTNWAITQNNIGTALMSLGSRHPNDQYLEQAVIAFEASLELTEQDYAPLRWANTKNNLGLALLELGEHDSETITLERSIAAFHDALTELRREITPYQWAKVKGNLGLAYHALGWRVDGTQNLKNATKSYQDALQQFDPVTAPFDWAMTQSTLGAALVSLGIRESGTLSLEEAAEACQLALSKFNLEQHPLQWATTQNTLGYSLMKMGQRNLDSTVIEQAIVAYNNALKVYRSDTLPVAWGKTTLNHGIARHEIGLLRNDINDLLEARQLIFDSWKLIQSIGFENYDNYYSFLLSNIEADIDLLEY